MTASLDREGSPAPVVPMGEPPPAWRSPGTVMKLAQRLGSVATRLLQDDYAYELAFRMVTAPLPERTVQR